MASGARRSKAPAFADVAFAHGIDRRLDVEIVPFDERFPPGGADHSPFSPHRPQFHLIAYYQRGRGHHEVDVRRYACGPGSMVFVAPGQVHCFERGSSLRGHLLVFTREALEHSRLLSSPVRGPELFNPHLFEPVAHLEEPDRQTFSRLVEEIVAEQGRPRDAVQQEVLYHLLGVWLLRCRRATGAIAAPRHAGALATFQRFAELLEAHRHETRNVVDYARLLDTSAHQLGRIVRLATGKTAKQVIDEDLVLEIKRRLVHRDETVSGIAEALGFEEVTNLVKYFKRHTGRTPGTFREHARDLPRTDPD